MPNQPKAEEVFGVLADKQAMKIFKMALNEFETSPEVPVKIGLTRKQYYSRLRRLLAVGLIEKTHRKYKSTLLGTIVANTQIKPLEEALSNYWSLLAANELKKSQMLPEQEQAKIIASIVSGTGLYSLERTPRPIKIIRTYEELVEELVAQIKSARQEIHIASRYYEPSVGQALIERFASGVKLNILDCNPSGTTLVDRLVAVLKASADPKTQALVLALLKSPDVRIRVGKLDYSFVVIDGERSGIEVPNSLNPHDFNLAIGFQDQDFSKGLIAYFGKLWQSAEEPKTRFQQMPI